MKRGEGDRFKGAREFLGKLQQYADNPETQTYRAIHLRQTS